MYTVIFDAHVYSGKFTEISRLPNLAVDPVAVGDVHRPCGPQRTLDRHSPDKRSSTHITTTPVFT